MLERGATTAWEWWDAVGDDGAVRGSLNHYSKAAVRLVPATRTSPASGSTRFRMPHPPAIGRVRIAPLPGGGLTWARASVDTPLGRLASSWRIEDGWFSLDVEVPAGSIATVELPDGERHEVGPGMHAFRHPVA